MTDHATERLARAIFQLHTHNRILAYEHNRQQQELLALKKGAAAPSSSGEQELRRQSSGVPSGPPADSKSTRCPLDSPPPGLGLPPEANGFVQGSADALANRVALQSRDHLNNEDSVLWGHSVVVSDAAPAGVARARTASGDDVSLMSAIGRGSLDQHLQHAGAPVFEAVPGAGISCSGAGAGTRPRSRSYSSSFAPFDQKALSEQQICSGDAREAAALRLLRDSQRALASTGDLVLSIQQRLQHQQTVGERAARLDTASRLTAFIHHSHGDHFSSISGGSFRGAAGRDTCFRLWRGAATRARKDRQLREELKRHLSEQHNELTERCRDEVSAAVGAAVAACEANAEQERTQQEEIERHARSEAAAVWEREREECRAGLRAEREAREACELRVAGAEARLRGVEKAAAAKSGAVRARMRAFFERHRLVPERDHEVRLIGDDIHQQGAGLMPWSEVRSYWSPLASPGLLSSPGGPPSSFDGGGSFSLAISPYLSSPFGSVRGESRSSKGRVPRPPKPFCLARAVLLAWRERTRRLHVLGSLVEVKRDAAAERSSQQKARIFDCWRAHLRERQALRSGISTTTRIIRFGHDARRQRTDFLARLWRGWYKIVRRDQTIRRHVTSVRRRDDLALLRIFWGGWRSYCAFSGRMDLVVGEEEEQSLASSRMYHLPLPGHRVERGHHADQYDLPQWSARSTPSAFVQQQHGGWNQNYGVAGGRRRGSLTPVGTTPQNDPLASAIHGLGAPVSSFPARPRGLSADPRDYPRDHGAPPGERDWRPTGEQDRFFPVPRVVVDEIGGRERQRHADVGEAALEHLFTARLRETESVLALHVLRGWRACAKRGGLRDRRIESFVDRRQRRFAATVLRGWALQCGIGLLQVRTW